MSEHTPGELRLSGADIRAKDGVIVATAHPYFASDGRRQAANAARIVHAWNLHDELVAALESCAALRGYTATWEDEDNALSAADAVLAKEKGE